MWCREGVQSADLADSAGPFCGGAACLLCALSAEGRSEIHSAEIILRGYEKIAEKLCAVGANIKIEDF